jgi:hypothetical protein
MRLRTFFQYSNIPVMTMFLLLCAMLFALCFSAQAQQQTKIPRIGYISGAGSPADPGPYVEALRQGLRDLGDIEGKNFVIEYRGAQGKAELIPGLVAASYNSGWMFSWSQQYHRSAPLSRQPKRSPSLW